MKKQGYYVEHNGDCWQSIFPSREAHLSQNHVTVADAQEYIQEVKPGVKVTVVNVPEGLK